MLTLLKSPIARGIAIGVLAYCAILFAGHIYAEHVARDERLVLAVSDGKRAIALRESYITTLERLKYSADSTFDVKDSVFRRLLHQHPRVDTIPVTDTEWVDHYVFSTDSLVGACTAAVDACAAAGAKKDSLIAAQKAQIVDQQRLVKELTAALSSCQRSKTGRSVRDLVLGGGIGFGVCRLSR